MIRRQFCGQWKFGLLNQVLLQESRPSDSCNDTRLDNAIVLKGNVFQHNHTLVNREKSALNISEFMNYIRSTIVNTVRTHPGLEAFRDNKVTIASSYKEMKGEFIAEIEVTPADYTN